MIVTNTPQPPESLEKTPVSLNNKLGGPQSRSGRFVGKNKVLFLDRVEPRTIQPASKLLYRLRYTAYNRQEA
jgi:hypothetical protein